MFEKLPPIQFVIHLAINHRGDADWQSVLVNNIHGTHNVYQAALSKGSVQRIVFASSNHVAGSYEYVEGSAVPNRHRRTARPIIDGDSPLRPDGIRHQQDCRKGHWARVFRVVGLHPSV